MSRSLTRVLVAVLTVLPLASRTYAADSGSGALLDTFGLFAIDELRTRGFTDSTSSVGVNQGTLHSGGALSVPKGTVAANSVHLGGGSVCQKLVANVVTQGSPGCGPAMPLDSAVLGVVDPAEACGFPKPFPSCAGGPAVTVPHGGVQVLKPGTYGNVLVQGGGAGAGTLILNGGKYVFCNLQVSRYAKLYAKAAAEIDVFGELAFSNQTTIGPAPGSTITARSLEIFVNGDKSRFSRKSKVHAKLCAPNGALFINDGASLDGCAVAKRIHTDRFTVSGTCAGPPSSTTTSTTLPSPTTTTTTTTRPVSTTIVQTTTTIEGSTTTTSTSSTTPPMCGNGIVEPGEECDGSVSGAFVCLDSANQAVLEPGCPVCTTGENGCKLDCSCCPSGRCGPSSTTTTSLPSVTTTQPSVTTTSTTTTSTQPVPTTSSSTSSTQPVPTTSTSTSSSSTLPIPPTTSTSTSTTSTQPIPTTSTSTSTSSTQPVPTTTSSTSSTSTSSSTSSTVQSPGTTTTTVPTLAFTIGNGTNNCGGAGLATPPAMPLSGSLLDGTNTKIADLGLGCLYFGGGKNTNVPGGIIPTGSTTFFRIISQNGNAVILGGADGPRTSCTKGAGPNKHCIKGEAGTDGMGACTSDANCANHVGSCVLDANCFFGSPLSIPNPNVAGTSTCVINVIQNDVLGTGDLVVGSAAVAMTLASRVYLTGTAFDDSTTPIIEACPRCLSGTCNKGANAGKQCVTTAPNLVSLDCPPLATQFLATLPIALNPFSTAPTQIQNATGVFCPNQVTAPSSSLNTGALGKTTARTVKEAGSPAGNITDHLPHTAALGSTFCIPATGNQLIDPVAGLPGPGALSVTGQLVLQ